MWIVQLVSLIFIHWIVIYPVDSAIHRINLYPLDSAIGFPNSLGSDLSGGKRLPHFERLGPVIVESHPRCKLNILSWEQACLEFVHPISCPFPLSSGQVSGCSEWLFTPLLGVIYFC